MLILNDAEVRSALDMPRAIAAVEGALQQQARGRAYVGERQNVRYDGGWIRLMPCALLDDGVVGYKEFHLGGDGVRYACHLFDAARGTPLAQMDANFLTQIRTGATGGVALRYLVPMPSVRAAVIGAGAEARTQLEALAAVRQVTDVHVYSPREARRAEFAAEMGARLGLAIEPSDSPAEAVGDADVVLVATNTGLDGQTAFDAAWLRPGQHLNSIGSTMPEQRELDHEVWRSVGRVVVDTLALLEESGDARAASQHGTLDPSRIVELADVVRDGVPPARSPEEVTLYKSVGTALQDVAVAAAAYRQAVEMGLGNEIRDYQSVKELHR